MVFYAHKKADWLPYTCVSVFILAKLITLVILEVCWNMSYWMGFWFSYLSEKFDLLCKSILGKIVWYLPRDVGLEMEPYTPIICFTSRARSRAVVCHFRELFVFIILTHSLWHCSIVNFRSPLNINFMYRYPTIVHLLKFF